MHHNDPLWLLETVWSAESSSGDLVSSIHEGGSSNERLVIFFNFLCPNQSLLLPVWLLGISQLSNCLWSNRDIINSINCSWCVQIDVRLWPHVELEKKTLHCPNVIIFVPTVNKPWASTIFFFHCEDAAFSSAHLSTCLCPSFPI